MDDSTQWQPDEDDAPWSPERDARDQAEEAEDPDALIRSACSPDELKRVDAVIARYRGPSNRPLMFGERVARFLCDVIEAIGDVPDPGLRAAAHDITAARRRRTALFDLVIFAEAAFGDVDVLALTTRVPASALRRVLAGDSRHRFGPESIRRVTRALWCQMTVETRPRVREYLEDMIDQLRRCGAKETRRELAFLDSAADRHAELARQGAL